VGFRCSYLLSSADAILAFRCCCCAKVVFLLYRYGYSPFGDNAGSSTGTLSERIDGAAIVVDTIYIPLTTFLQRRANYHRCTLVHSCHNKSSAPTSRIGELMHRARLFRARMYVQECHTNAPALPLTLRQPTHLIHK
jgi:hypothetical protein